MTMVTINPASLCTMLVIHTNIRIQHFFPIIYKSVLILVIAPFWHKNDGFHFLNYFIFFVAVCN